MPLSAGEVHVYSVDPNCSASELTQAQEWLTVDELGRMKSFHFFRSLVLQLDRYGKPSLLEVAGVHFNLAASADLAGLCFSGEGEVGIDFEQIRPLGDLPSLARAVLTRGELSEILNLRGEAQLIGFLRYWNRKEPCLKAAGVGLSVDANRLDFRHGRVRWEESSPQGFGLENWTLHEFNPGPGYAGACVATQGSTRIRFAQVALDSIAAELR